MDLFEYQGKQLFARYGIPVSAGEVADTVDDAVAAAERVGYPVVVKAQVQVGGRGKAGGVKLAENADEVRTHAGNILGLDIKGHVVHARLGRARVRHRGGVLRVVHARPRREAVPRACCPRRVVSRSRRSPTRTPTRSRASTSIRSTGLSEAQCRAWVEAAKLNPQATDGAVDILMKLYNAYVDGDADLVEINPLILTPDGKVHALDAKVSLDDNARFRHPEWDELTGLEKLDPREREAAEKGLQYVGLDGDVGVIANGAGLAMATCDIVHEVGGKPANFLDIGGGASAQVMANALEVINNDPSVKSIFINIFGGITKGEEVANGIVQALGQVDIASPIVIRLDGTNAEEGREILKCARVGPTRQSSRRWSKPRARPSRWPEERSEHSRQRRHEGASCRASPASQGRFYGLRNRAYGTQGRRRGAARRRPAPTSRAFRCSRRSPTRSTRDRRDRDDGDRARARRPPTRCSKRPKPGSS